MLPKCPVLMLPTQDHEKTVFVGYGDVKEVFQNAHTGQEYELTL